MRSCQTTAPSCLRAQALVDLDAFGVRSAYDVMPSRYASSSIARVLRIHRLCRTIVFSMDGATQVLEAMLEERQTVEERERNGLRERGYGPSSSLATLRLFDSPEGTGERRRVLYMCLSRRALVECHLRCDRKSV